jgi:transposase
MRRLRVRSLYHREHIKKLRRLQRSGQACVARWATILLLSHQGRSVQEIAAGMGLHVQTVRTRIRTFNGAERTRRWDLLRPPRRPGRTPTYGPAVQQGLVDLLKQSPEQFGIDSGVWRLHDLVTVAKRTGLVTGPARRTFNVETVRRLLRKAGYVYLSAKWWITSDDPHYAHKKARRDAILAWAKRDPSIRVVFQDESWFSGTPKAVGQYGQRGQPRTAAVEKPAHKCKGAWVLYAALDVLTGRVQRFYAPRCNQTYVRQQLAALLTQAQAAGKRVLVVIWDNASWHTAKALRRWYYRYNQTAKRTGQVRLLLVALPSRSPWLNPIEPVFGQAKRHIVGRRPVAQPGRLKRKTESYFKRRDTRLARKAVHPTAQT